MEVILRNPGTGAREAIVVGWSWKIFAFSFLFGLPLFTLKLKKWGAAVAFLVSALIIPGLLYNTLLLMGAPSFAGIKIASPEFMQVWKYLAYWNEIILSILIVMAIILSLKGSKMAALNFLNNGWEFAEPETNSAKLARSKWGVPETKTES